ncbi:MAG: two-component regulator propeller domain-containing protein [Pseudomonadota bacterium]
MGISLNNRLLNIQPYPWMHAIDMKKLSVYFVFWCYTTLAYSVEEFGFYKMEDDSNFTPNYINQIIQDKYGFLWIASKDGLYRYSGTEFVPFIHDPFLLSSIPSNDVTDVIEDNNEGLWIGTAEGHVAFLEPNHQKFHSIDLFKDSNTDSAQLKVINLFQASDNRLYVGTEYGIFIYDPKTKDIVTIRPNPIEPLSIPTGLILSIQQDSRGKIYLLTTDGIGILEGNEFYSLGHLLFDKTGFDNLQFTTLFIDSDNSLWIGTQEHGLFHYYPINERLEFFTDTTDIQVPDNAISSIYRDIEGALWVGTKSGLLGRINLAARDYKIFKRNPFDTLSLRATESISTLFQDARGALWIGTDGNGLFKSPLKNRKFQRLTRNNELQHGLPGNIIYDLEYDAQGARWWIVTNMGLSCYVESTTEFKHISNSQLFTAPGDEKITLVKQVDPNHLWLATNMGRLIEYQIKTKAYKELDIFGELGGQFNERKIVMLEKDRLQLIWMSTNHGLLQIDPIKHQVVNVLLGRDAQVMSMLHDEMGQYWFGTEGDGLIRYVPETQDYLKFVHIEGKRTSLSNNTIYSLITDQEKNLWIATANGLNKLTANQMLAKSPAFEPFMKVGNIRAGRIYGIATDVHNALWMSTTNGLINFNPSTHYAANYTVLDGLTSSEHTRVSVLKTAQGDIAFGTSSGINVVKNQEVKIKVKPANMLLTNIRFGNEYLKQKFTPWHAWHEPQLDSHNNQLTVWFAQTDYNRPKRNQYQYRLLGLNDMWSEPSANTNAIFANLQPGRYIFEVKSYDDDIHQTSTQAAFTVLSPLYQRWWAIAMYFIAVALLVFLIVYRQQKRILEQQYINEQLSRIDKLKDEFLANTSHELKTPLNGIIGLAESLIEGVAGEQNQQTKNHLNLIAHSGKRLSHLVGEILDFKKITYHNLQLLREPVILKPVVEIVYTSCQTLIKNKKIKLVNAITQDLPPIHADSNRLQQILYNLIDNAIKYTEVGEITISAVAISEEKIEISVSDTGIGIDAENLKRIFEPFEQVEDSVTKKYKGSGLGLAISKQLVELHGSQLEVSSQLERGSRFSFALPIANELPQALKSHYHLSGRVSSKIHTEVVRDNLTEHAQTAFNEGAFEPSYNGRVLIADDEPVNRQIISDILSLEGFEVIQAHDGNEVLDTLFKTGQNNFDLVILDVMMPKLSGFDVCKAIRQHKTPIELPILMVSAKTRPEDIMTGLECGANDYIAKPIERKELIARVKTLVLLREVGEARREKHRVTTLEQVIQQLGKYFPKSVAEKILAEDKRDALAPTRRMITVLFSDLTEFTTLTDRFEPEVIVRLLNEYLSEMGVLIEHHGGILNEILGDGLVILFGAPNEQDKVEQIESSIKLAIDMQNKMQELANQWLEEGIDHHVQLRIGIHQDFATVGNIGAQNFLAYRAVGSAVNLSARLQSESPAGGIVVSYPLYIQMKDKFSFGELKEKIFKGFMHPHRYCEVNISKKNSIAKLNKS